MVEPIVGMALGLLGLVGVTIALAAASRWVVRANARAEAADTAALVAEAVSFDLRRAGWDPAGTGLPPIVRASGLELELAADLDGNGTIDPRSAERVRLRCSPARRTLSRLIGAQSMPLASITSACGFTYLDRRRTPLPMPAGEVLAEALASIAIVVLDVTIRPPGSSVGHPRRVTVALRGAGR